MIRVDTPVQGVLAGGLHAPLAAGLGAVFGIMRLMNLAHGDHSGDPGSEPDPLCHRAGPDLSRDIARSGDGQPGDIRSGRVFPTATGLAIVVAAIAALCLGVRSNFDPAIGQARLTYAFEARGMADGVDPVGAEMGLDIVVHVVGPRQTQVDHTGDRARGCEVRDSGCVLLRPDHHVGWRADEISEDPEADLRRVVKTILAR